MRRLAILFALMVCVAISTHAQTCSNTAVGSFTCVRNAANNASATSTSVTFTGGYTSGQLIVVQGNCNGCTVVSGNLSNTNGYTWTFWGHCPWASSASDQGLWYVKVPSTTGGSDTITMSNASSTFTWMNVVIYSGVGLIDGAGVCNPNQAANTSSSSGNYSVTVNDLNLGFLGTSSGLGVAGSGWANRESDSIGGGPFTIIEDQIAASGTANASFTFSNGFSSVIGIAFKAPLTPPTITSASTVTFTLTINNSFTVTASGNPASSFSETGALPSGVTLSSGGILSGTPGGGVASYPIVITANNGNAPNATQNFTLTVATAFFTGQIISGPMLPQATPSAAYPPDTGYTITPVVSGSNLQTQINNAACGTKLNLAHNGTFAAGILNLPNLDVGANSCQCHTDATKWRIIQGDQFAVNYTPGVTTDPSAQYSQYPHISSNDANYLFYALAASNCWGFAGLDMTETTDGANAVLALGDATFSVANYPQYFAIWGCYIHGLPTKSLIRGVMGNDNWLALVDNYLSDFHSASFDAQGFAAWDGLGPWLIQHNSIEAATENVIFGGGPSQPGQTPSDITIQKNYIWKPLAWRPGDPTYIGIHWIAKDSVEFKVGQRILFTANVMDTTWQDGQQELEIFNVGCSGTAPGNNLSDLTQFYNIFRHGPGALVYGGCGQGATQAGHRLYSHDNLWWDIDQCKWGACANLNTIIINSGPFGSPVPPFNLYDAWHTHETYSGDHMQMGLDFNNGNSGNSYYGFQFINSIIGNATSVTCWVGGQGEFSSRCGDLTFGDFTPGGKFNNNCFYGTSASGGSYLNATFTGLKQPATPALVFVNPGVDFHVAKTSVCSGAASDGLDMGANIDAINSATAGVVQTLVNPVTVTNISPATFTHLGSTSITITGTNFLNESGLGVIIGGAGPTSAMSTNSCGFASPGQFTITAFTDTSHFTYTGGCVVVMAAPVTVALNDTINVIVNSAQTSGTINRYTPGNACTSVMVTNSTTITCTTPAASGAVTTGPVSVFVSQWGIPIQSTVFPSYN